MKNKRYRPAAWWGVLPLLVAAGCTFQEPAQPDWDVNLELPLIGRRYTMVDLADEINELIVDEESDEVLFSFDQDFDTFKIGDKLKVSGASKTASIPVSGTLVDSVDIPADIVVVDTAAIKHGVVDLGFNNPGGNAVTIRFNLPDIQDAEGEALSQLLVIPAGGYVSRRIILDGYLIVPPTWDGVNYIRFSAAVQGASSGQPVSVNIDIGEMVFSYVSGIVNALELEIEDSEADLDIPDTFKDFRIQRASLKLAVNLGMDFPVVLDLTVEGFDTRDGSHPVIQIQGDIGAGSPVDTLEIEGFADFINAMPEQVRISGKFILGDGVTKGRVTEDHVIETRGFFMAPLTFTLPTVDTKTEVDTLEIDEDARDVLRDNFIEGHVTAEVENGLPIGGKVSIFFSRTRSDSTIYDLDPSVQSPDYYVFVLHLGAGLVDASDPAVVTQTTPSTLAVDLDATNLPLFYNNERLFWGIKLESEQTGVMVKVRPTDFFDVTARISAKVNTYFDEDDEEGGAS